MSEEVAVFELDEAVDDGFGVNEDIDFSVGEAEEVVSFDDFEAFIYEGGGVDEVFEAHLGPARVGEDLRGGDVFELLAEAAEEGAAGAGEDDFFDVFDPAALQALENGGLLGVDGDEGGQIPACAGMTGDAGMTGGMSVAAGKAGFSGMGFAYDRGAGFHEGFFAGESDRVAGAEGSFRGLGAGAAD